MIESSSSNNICRIAGIPSDLPELVENKKPIFCLLVLLFEGELTASDQSPQWSSESQEVVEVFHRERHLLRTCLAGFYRYSHAITGALRRRAPDRAPKICRKMIPFSFDTSTSARDSFTIVRTREWRLRVSFTFGIKRCPKPKTARQIQFHKLTVLWTTRLQNGKRMERDVWCRTLPYKTSIILRMLLLGLVMRRIATPFVWLLKMIKMADV